MSDAKRVLVIGGSAAGLKAACRLKRLKPNFDITVFERTERISFASCGLPYYLSGDIDDIHALVATPWGAEKNVDYFRTEKGVDVRTGHEVVAIHPQKKSVSVRRSGSDSSREEAYDTLILATGASPILLDLPGCRRDGICCFSRPDEAIEIRHALERNELGRVVIVGGGYIGLELCEAFGALWGVEVVLVEKEKQVLAPNLDPEMAALLEKHLREQGVALRLGNRVERVEHTETAMIAYLDDGSKEHVDRVVVAVGVRPNSRLAFEAELVLGPRGGILVDLNGRSSDPHIYAAGDCAELDLGDETRLLPLGSIANRMGRIVANSIADQEQSGLSRPHGAGVVKVFDLNVASVGKSALRASAEGLEIEEYWGTFYVEAHYYPENRPVMMKLVKEKGGKLLGLQVVGKGDVVRWVNSFGQILDLADGDPAALARFEHAYAPPYANALDPFHHFAGIIEADTDLQVSSGLWQTFADDPKLTWVNLLSPEERKATVLPEFAGQVVEWTPAELREKGATLPKEGVILFCAKGPRSSEAARYLTQLGVHARYMAGGTAFL